MKVTWKGSHNYHGSFFQYFTTWCDVTFDNFLKKRSGQWLTLFFLRPFQTTMVKYAEQLEEIELWYREDIFIYVLSSGDVPFRMYIPVYVLGIQTGKKQGTL